MRRMFLCVLAVLLGLQAFPQSPVRKMMKIVDSLQYILPDSAYDLCLAIEERFKSDPPDSRTRIRVIVYKANIFWHKGDFGASMKIYHDALESSRANNDRYMEANVLGDIGYVYSDMGKYDSAVVYLVNAARIADELKDEMVIARIKMFTADNYMLMQKYDKAIEIYRYLLWYYTKSKEEYDVGANLNNIAECYLGSGRVDSARYYFEEAIAVFKRLDMPSELGIIYQNYSAIYYQEGDVDKALEYAEKAKENFILTKSWENVASTSVTEAFYLLKQGKVHESIGKYNEALAMADSLISLPLKRNIYLGLSNCYKALKQYDKAYEYHVLHAAIKDSIINESNARMIGELEAKYENEKKEARISVQQAEIKAKENEIGRQNQQKIFFAGGFVLMMLLSFAAYKAYMVKRKDNTIINTQKKIVEEKNREIMDSIAYARRLQEAILPPQKLISSHLPRSFILYKPKDIVAGDFYWLESFAKATDSLGSEALAKEAEGGLVLFAAADCTGHGVPGAMVSVVCSNALNRTVKEFGITEPGRILDKVRELVIETFEKSESEVKDGMDISLCALDMSENKLTWAGANNPLWLIRNGYVLETRPDKQPIGKYTNEKAFTTHTIQLEAGDTIYIFTDGYADQFGGPKGKKFKYSQLKELLVSVQHEPMDRQKMILDNAFESWRGSLEQVDDVCVFGIRISS